MPTASGKGRKGLGPAMHLLVPTWCRLVSRWSWNSPSI